MFVVTLVALAMPGVTRAQMTMTLDAGNDVVLTVQPGASASATIPLPSGTTLGSKTTLALDGYPAASARAEQVPSDGGFHVRWSVRHSREDGRLASVASPTPQRRSLC